MTDPASPGRPGAPPVSARCPGPARPRRCAWSPGNYPTSRTFPSCRTADPARTSPAGPRRCWSTSPSRSLRAAGGWPNVPAAIWPGPGTMLSSDLDALEEVLDGFRGPVKIQVCGPWTLAATLELTRTMNVAIADPGAVADLTASLAEGVAAATRPRLSKRVPGARLVVQLDEPALAAVAGGEVPTASGLSRIAPRRSRCAAGAAGPGDRGHREVHGGTQLARRPCRSELSGRRAPVPCPSTSASYGEGKRTRWPRPPRRALGC